MIWQSYFSSLQESKKNSNQIFFLLIEWKGNLEGKRHIFAIWKLPYYVRLRGCDLISLSGASLLTHWKNWGPRQYSTLRKCKWICGKGSVYQHKEKLFCFILESLLNLLQYWFCFMFYFVVVVLGDGSQDIWYLSFPNRDWTCTRYIGRQSLNHWTAKEVQNITYLN